MAERADVSKKKMEEVELRLMEAVLYMMADEINALMRDGIPYTKVRLTDGRSM